MNSPAPLVGVIMGSESDWQVMRPAAQVLTDLGVATEVTIVSAHRTPQRLFDYCRSLQSRGFKALIAGAGGAAHLPGMAASLCLLPVVGVPVMSKKLQGMDSLLSIVQMPQGVPVACMAIDGARNAGLFAARILALGDAALAQRLLALSRAQEKEVLAQVRAWEEDGPPAASKVPS